MNRIIASFLLKYTYYFHGRENIVSPSYKLSKGKKDWYYFDKIIYNFNIFVLDDLPESKCLTKNLKPCQIPYVYNGKFNFA